MNPTFMKIIFDRYYVNLESAENVRKELELSKEDWREVNRQIKKDPKFELKEMGRIRQLFHNKKNTHFEFIDSKGEKSFREFYNWYLKRRKDQNGSCYYCWADEKEMANFLKKRRKHIRRPNRGQHLEVERKNARTGDYSAQNCVLACYFCNNDKSDIFNEDEYRSYLKNRKLFFNAESKKN